MLKLWEHVPEEDEVSATIFLEFWLLPTRERANFSKRLLIVSTERKNIDKQAPFVARPVESAALQLRRRGFHRMSAFTRRANAVQRDAKLYAKAR